MRKFCQLCTHGVISSLSFLLCTSTNAATFTYEQSWTCSGQAINTSTPGFVENSSECGTLKVQAPDTSVGSIQSSEIRVTGTGSTRVKASEPVAAVSGSRNSGAFVTQFFDPSSTSALPIHQTRSTAAKIPAGSLDASITTSITSDRNSIALSGDTVRLVGRPVARETFAPTERDGFSTFKQIPLTADGFDEGKITSRYEVITTEEFQEPRQLHYFLTEDGSVGFSRYPIRSNAESAAIFDSNGQDVTDTVLNQEHMPDLSNVQVVSTDILTPFFLGNSPDFQITEEEIRLLGTVGLVEAALGGVFKSVLRRQSFNAGTEGGEIFADQIDEAERRRLLILESNSPVVASTLVQIPDDTIELSFDYMFSAPSSSLEVLFGDLLIADLSSSFNILGEHQSFKVEFDWFQHISELTFRYNGPVGTDAFVYNAFLNDRSLLNSGPWFRSSESVDFATLLTENEFQLAVDFALDRNAVAPVPLPASLPLLLAGLGGVFLMGQCKKN